MSAKQLFDELYYIIWSYVCQWTDFFEPSSPAKYLPKLNSSEQGVKNSGLNGIRNLSSAAMPVQCSAL